MITSQNIALTTNYEVISVQDNEITLRVIPTDVILKIKNSKCHLTYDKDSHSIKIQYFKKWSKSIQSFINVWRKSLVKYDKAPLFEYEIEVLYKHFPIIVEKVKDKTLKISNFMGLKKDFLIDINSAISVQVLDKKIIVQSYNDILTGSDLEELNKLRYKTHLKNLDRRIFTDGFNIVKEAK